MRIEAGIDPRTARILYVRAWPGTGPGCWSCSPSTATSGRWTGCCSRTARRAWANGEPTGQLELSKVEFLDDVPESAFEP